jgi:hypothetical protein
VTDFLLDRQKMLDRLNAATENLLQAKRDMIRAEELADYWRRQVEQITTQLDRHKAD